MKKLCCLSYIPQVDRIFLICMPRGSGWDLYSTRIPELEQIPRHVTCLIFRNSGWPWISKRNQRGFNGFSNRKLHTHLETKSNLRNVGSMQKVAIITSIVLRTVMPCFLRVRKLSALLIARLELIKLNIVRGCFKRGRGVINYAKRLSIIRIMAIWSIASAFSGNCS